MIHPDRLGHVVIKVRDLERSRNFYTALLGLEVMGEVPEFRLLFLASNRRDHHELGLMEVGPNAEPGQSSQVGLLHIAFRLRNFDELREAYQDLKRWGVTIRGTVDHGVAKGIYFLDPDGNELEVYCDGDPEKFGQWPNHYAGREKLEFAADLPGLGVSIPPAAEK